MDKFLINSFKIVIFFMFTACNAADTRVSYTIFWTPSQQSEGLGYEYKLMREGELFLEDDDSMQEWIYQRKIEDISLVRFVIPDELDIPSDSVYWNGELKKISDVKELSDKGQGETISVGYTTLPYWIYASDLKLVYEHRDIEYEVHILRWGDDFQIEIDHEVFSQGIQSLADLEALNWPSNTILQVESPERLVDNYSGPSSSRIYDKIDSYLIDLREKKGWIIEYIPPGGVLDGWLE